LGKLWESTRASYRGGWTTHLLRVDVGHTTRLSDDGKVGFDWWGAG